jgi:hypothetical protein
VAITGAGLAACGDTGAAGMGTAGPATAGVAGIGATLSTGLADDGADISAPVAATGAAALSTGWAAPLPVSAMAGMTTRNASVASTARTAFFSCMPDMNQWRLDLIIRNYSVITNHARN